MIQEVLKGLDYRDGQLVATCTSGRRKAGDQIGYRCRTSGYVRYRCAGSNYYVHRLIWELLHGPLPDGMQIDHINGIRHDNRIENLRVVTRQDNLKNAKLRVNNISGTPGITELKCGRFRARIGNAKRTIYLGEFRTKQAAINARKSAEARLGYHQNHGRKSNAADHA